MSRLPIVELPAGSTEPLTLTLRDEAEAAIDYSSSTPTLSFRAWPGDDRAAITLADSAIAWASAAAGTVTLTVDGGDTGSLSGDYRVQVGLTSAGKTTWEDVCILRFTASPGSATAPAVYCTLDDLRRLAGGWLLDLVEQDADQAGFAEQRADARRWFDHLLQRHYRPATSYRQDTLDHLYDGRIGARRRTGAHDATLQAWLDDNRLVLTTPTGRQILDACACYAIALVCDRQVTGRDDDPWPVRARTYRLKAERLAQTITAEVDTATTADGVGDLLIDLGTADRLRA